VRNPLTAVQIDLQYVQSQLPKDSPLKEPQSKALAEIRRLDDTVRDALRVARSGRIQLRLIDLRDPIRAALDAAGPLLAAKEAVVETSLPPDPVTMDGDPGALEQVFLNLLMNASEAIESGGTVSISAMSESSEVRVAVSDDGVGMSDDVRARAFEPLFSTRREGTGLGLPIARRIVLAHGGVVRIDATPGSGTTVEVVLPGPESSVSMPPLAGA
jgi:signal transduction histidine kinase